MDTVSLKQKAGVLLRKYRYALLVLLVGAVLLLWSSDNTPDQGSAAAAQTDQVTVTEELTKILSQIRGVGRVEVMLSVAVGQETIYVYDEDVRTGESGTTKKDTVIITDKDRNESGLIKVVIPEQYLGAVVVCEGADQPAVKLAVVEAVSRATGLGADRITVQKMK